MIDRILDFSLEPARLSIRNSLLVIETGGMERAAIPCEEIAAIVISHRQVTFTQAVLSELAKAGAIAVTCDEKFVPAAMLLPIDSHHAQAERFRRQATLAAPKKKRLWQALVRAKIRAQAAALEDLIGGDEGLRALPTHVTSGDTQNVEARAARRYWLHVFSDPKFFRGNPDDPRNALLNYGYTVLRAVTARAICGAGLHPSFCLFHANVHNPFGLADDLMEPFRPVVDRTVALQVRSASADSPLILDSVTKRAIIQGILARIEADGEKRTLTDVLSRVSQSLAGIVMGERRLLWLPDWKPTIHETMQGPSDYRQTDKEGNPDGAFPLPGHVALRDV